MKNNALAPERTSTTSVGEWLAYGEKESERYTSTEPSIVAEFTTATRVEIQWVNLSRDEDNPDIAVVYRGPRVSHRRSPAGTKMSPLELFLAFERGNPVPDVLSRHHRALARRGIFDQHPRALPLPLWAEPSQHGFPPDVEPLWGEVDLCEGDFTANWLYFSTWHGVNRPYTQAPFEMWTGWSVVTGWSVPRSCAMCLPASANPNPPDGLYEILNRQEGGDWESIYTQPIALGADSGVGFQTYGPGKGRTRIRLTTQDDQHGLFLAGASWGEPEDWLSANPEPVR